MTARMFDVKDTHKEGKVVATFPTHRRALNYCRKLEPGEPHEMPRGGWRYVISPRKV